MGACTRGRGQRGGGAVGCRCETAGPGSPTGPRTSRRRSMPRTSPASPPRFSITSPSSRSTSPPGARRSCATCSASSPWRPSAPSRRPPRRPRGPAGALTVTLGLGPGLFGERFGLAGRRPVALADLPAFPGDALEPAWTGGDLCLQVCADEAARGDRAPRQRRPRALRQRGRIHRRPGERRDGRPRNLLGFKDATANPRRGRDPRPPRVGPARRPHRDDGRDVPRRAARPPPARRPGNALSARSRSG